MSMLPKTLNARERFARNLRAWRAARGLSQQRLADHAGLSRVFISKVERCTNSVSLDTIEKIATVLSVDIADLLIETQHHLEPEVMPKN